MVKIIIVFLLPWSLLLREFSANGSLETKDNGWWSIPISCETKLQRYPTNSYKIIFKKDKKILNNSSLLSSQKAQLVSVAFLDVFVTFHRLWSNYDIQRRYWERLNDRVKAIFTPYYVHFCISTTTIGLILAAYLFSDLKDLPSSLSPSQHTGFGCLYFIIATHIILDIVLVIHTIADAVKNFLTQDLKNLIPYRLLIPHIACELILFGILSSLIMTHIKFSSFSPTFHYYYIPLPMYFFFAFAIFALKDTLAPTELIILMITLLCLPLGLTFIAFYYDPSIHFISSLIYATIPFYFPTFVILVVSFFFILENVHSTRNCIELIMISEEIHIGLLLHVRRSNKINLLIGLLPGIMKLCFCLMTVMTLLYFLIEINSLSLGQATMIILIALNCAYCTLQVMIFKFLLQRFK